MAAVSDCRDFILHEHVGTKVDGTAPIDQLDNVGRGECFLACFNKTGCYTFSYDVGNQRCDLYTGCGAFCVLIADSAMVTYVRECAEPSITGMYTSVDLSVSISHSESIE